MSDAPEVKNTGNGLATPLFGAVPMVGLLLLCGVVLWLGLRATRHTDWPDPYEYDILRDIGIAQSMLDGRYPEDHVYPGEVQWYNPGIGALIAVGSCLSGAPPPLVAARLGAVLNILPAVMFFVMMSVLFDRWTALAAVAFFLFSKGPLTASWMFASYTPWLLAANFALAPLFAAFTALVKAMETDSLRWYAGAGVLLGITFMFHTASAVLFGGVLVLLLLYRIRRKRQAGEVWRRLLPGPLLLLIIAFVVSLPYSGPILRRYQFRVQNPWPTWLCEPRMSLERLPELLWSGVCVASLVALIGLVLLWRSREKPWTKPLLACWFAVGGAFLVYTYFWQIVEMASIRLPNLVPGFHFLLLLSVLRSVLCGYALTAGVRRLAQRLFPDSDRLLGNLCVCAATLLVFLFYLPAYRNAPMFTKTQDAVSWAARFTDITPAYAWLMENTRPEDVVLCRERQAILIAGPAGRKVVATMLFYSNLYLDFNKRFHDRDAMFRAIQMRDETAFLALAREYHIAYVLVQDEDIALVESAAFPSLPPAWRHENTVIYRMASTSDS